MYSRRSAEKETPNEDAAIVIPVGDRGVVMAVADGVGGLPNGDHASRLVLETLAEYVSKSSNPNRIRIAILDAIEKANRRVIQLGSNAATTLAVTQIIDRRMRTYHVGDSEVLLVGGRGLLKMRTLSHGPVAYGVHCGLIDPDEAMTHELRNLIFNVVGDREMRIEIGPTRKLAPRDVVLLCSDGITDNLTIKQIAEQISGKPAETAAETILDSLKQRRATPGSTPYKEDDVTMLVYRPA
jgi:serine/threonine protein phosphatase PrpC